MTECYLEIYHAEFNDGTPRHPLVSIKIKELEIAFNEMNEKLKGLMK